ncbi:MAG: type II secretion system protein, partial [Cloacibacillus sp.]
MKKGAAGFTLAETLIGVIIMAVVTASIAFGIRQALAVYGKAAAKSSVLTALRFTSDSYARKIVPMLHVAYKIEVRNDNAKIPAAKDLAKDERYLYLDGDAVTLRTQSGDETLPGSEYISKLSFSLPARTDDIDEDYLLTATITASRDVYETVAKSLDIKTALCNKPEKLNTADANGAVLRFFAKDTTALALTASMQLKNDYNGEILDGVTMPNGSKIRMSYTLKLNDGAGAIAPSEYTDNTGESIRWFISASKANDLTESSGDLSGFTEHLFMLVTQAGQPLSSDLLATPADDVYYVLSNGSATKWTPKEMIIRCRIAPCVTYQEQTVTSSPLYVYSDYVNMQKSVDKGMWDGWLESLKTGTGDGFKRTDVATDNSDKISLTVNNNTIVATIKASAERADVGAATVARLSYKWFENDRVNSIWNLSPKTSADIPPFMTLTNYSVIVDAEMPATTDGRSSVAYFWGILLNGTGSSGPDFNDTGYVFQYERKRGYPKQDESQPGLLIRKFEKGELVGYSKNTPQSYGIYNEADNDQTEDQRYLPENLHNDAFDFYNGKDDDAWTTRRRVMLTVLEYYTDDKTKPFYIIRAKFLKLTSDYTPADLAEIKKDDPWCIGKAFFASE